MTMRERIARAISDYRYKPGYRFDDTHDAERAFLLGEADAVLKAMREPTEAMVAAGDACDERDEFTATPRHAAECEVHWQAMIDAALSEGER